MARPEDLWEQEAICIAQLLKMNGISRKCHCPKCRGKAKARKNPEPEFPELLKKAGGDGGNG